MPAGLTALCEFSGKTGEGDTMEELKRKKGIVGKTRERVKETELLVTANNIYLLVLRL